jgi:Ca2+:H+ antiporter
VGAPDILTFALSVGALAPVAGLIGKATDELAQRVGPRLGGLLNATFGNAAELIITLFAVQSGLLTLVKASITGSIIGNTLFVLGFALLLGGLRHRPLLFDSRHAGVSAALMILAIAGLYLPAVFGASVPDHVAVERLSEFVAGVLLLIYGAYLVHTVLEDTRLGPAEQPTTGPAHEADAVDDTVSETPWSMRRSILVLAGATVGAAVCSEIMVSTVESVTQQLGWSEFFVGVVIVAVIGNAAEHFAAVQMAWKNRLDVSLSITAGSSTQIALFVAPVLVFASLVLGHPMDLVFTPLELAILGITTAIFAYISIDGESSWLEGVQLLGIYTIAAIAFFLIPVPPE